MGLGQHNSQQTCPAAAGLLGMRASQSANGLEISLAAATWSMSSVGMTLFNKLAILAFPAPCLLVTLQMLTTLLAMVFCWRSLHIGSLRDVLRWSMVIPFFTGMLLTSMLALTQVSMTLIVVFRSTTPLITTLFEMFYPHPLKINRTMIAALLVMVPATILYTSAMPARGLAGIHWVFMNMVCAVGDRLLQALMLSPNQSPVDISKTGVTLINNIIGVVPVLFCAFIRGELDQIPDLLAALNPKGVTWVSASCLVGVGISYCGIWAQSLISATSFLVLVNLNKFMVIILDACILKTVTLTGTQWLGACIAIFASLWYGLGQRALTIEDRGDNQKDGDEENAEENEEKSPLLPKK